MSRPYEPQSPQRLQNTRDTAYAAYDDDDEIVDPFKSPARIDTNDNLNIHNPKTNNTNNKNIFDDDDDFYQVANLGAGRQNSLRVPQQSYRRDHPSGVGISSDSDDAADIADHSSTSQTHFGQQHAYTDTHLGTRLGPRVGSPDSTESATEYTNSSLKRYKRGSSIFLGISIVSAILVLVFELYMYAVINIHKNQLNNARFQEISIYLSLFIFASIYQIGLTIFGLLTKNMLLLTLLCIFYICMLVYTGIQYQEVSTYISINLAGEWKKVTNATNIATIAVLGVTLISQAYLIFRVLRRDVSWFQYKKIGGDTKIRGMYTFFQIHRSLLIFNFFFFIGFTVQFLVIMVEDRTSVEFILTICVLPLTVILLVLSDIGTTREKLWIGCITIVTFLGGCAYVLFKMIRLYTKYSSAYSLSVIPGSYFPGRKSLITFGVITLVLLFATIFVEIKMVFNYNKGLLPVVSRSWKWVPGYSAQTYKTPIDLNPMPVAASYSDKTDTIKMANLQPQPYQGQDDDDLID